MKKALLVHCFRVRQHGLYARAKREAKIFQRSFPDPTNTSFLNRTSLTHTNPHEVCIIASMNIIPIESQVTVLKIQRNQSYRMKAIGKPGFLTLWRRGT